MYWACKRGHLDVVKWLFEVGAAKDIRAKIDLGYTPIMPSLSNHGGPDEAKELFEVGAAKDIQVKIDWGFPASC